MGLSISIASAIVLVGWLALVGAISTTMITAVFDMGTIVNSASNESNKLNVQLSLRITNVESSAINFSVLNSGSIDVFLGNETFAWNSVIVTYNDTDAQNNSSWQTYLIENYTVLAINVTGTNESFDLTSHQSIKPGEQAIIEVNLPPEAPEIPIGSVLNVVFASNYGVTASQEVFVSTYY
jgi:archaellum component FlaF (FlaF/FlaG flagellin family)